MAKIIKVKTSSRFEEIASYSRLVAIDNWIHVSNTAGRNPYTQKIPENVIEQTEHVIKNIERALAAVDATFADIVMSRVFIQNPQDTSDVMALIGKHFRDIEPATPVTCPPLGSPSYKVELEVTAYRGAARAQVEEITIIQ